MKFIGKDDILLDILKNEISILSSSVLRIDIFKQDFELIIEIDFELLYSKGNYIKLRFIGIKEYSFYHKDAFFFQYVESFKLIKDNESFYLSLAPENEFSTVPSDYDQDVIVCKTFEAYFIDPPGHV